MPEIGIQLQVGAVAERLRLRPGTTFESLSDIAQNYDGARICQSFCEVSLAATPVLRIRADKVRFTGYQVFGHGVYNVPELLMSIQMFARDGITHEQLNGMAKHMLVRLNPVLPYVHMIAKIYCGNVNGFSEINKPQD